MAKSEATFVTLEEFVRTPQAEAETPVVAAAPPPNGLNEALHEVRRFRAALTDALEAACEEVLRDVAIDVLARELLLAPAAIARIAEASLDRFWEEEPIALLAHPDEAAHLGALALPVRGDASLRRGDVMIALRFGSIDLTLGARLAHVLGKPR